MSEFDRLKAQKDAILLNDCGEDRFALAVRVLARLREARLIRIEGYTERDVQDNLHAAQIITMQVINAIESPGPRIGRSEVGQSPRASTATEGVDRVAGFTLRQMIRTELLGGFKEELVSDDRIAEFIENLIDKERHVL